MLKLITGLNKSKTITKHISFEWKCKFDVKVNVIQINGGIMINVNASTESAVYVKKYYVLNAATCSCKDGKYLANIMNESVITCDEIPDADEETITVPTNFNEKKYNLWNNNLYTWLPFLLIRFAILIGVSIYFYLIKYKNKTKPLITVLGAKKGIKEAIIDNINKKWVINSKIWEYKNTYYFFDDIINIKMFDPNNIKTDEKS